DQIAIAAANLRLEGARVAAGAWLRKREGCKLPAARQFREQRAPHVRRAPAQHRGSDQPLNCQKRACGGANSSHFPRQHAIRDRIHTEPAPLGWKKAAQKAALAQRANHCRIQLPGAVGRGSVRGDVLICEFCENLTCLSGSDGGAHRHALFCSTKRVIFSTEAKLSSTRSSSVIATSKVFSMKVTSCMPNSDEAIPVLKKSSSSRTLRANDRKRNALTFEVISALAGFSSTISCASVLLIGRFHIGRRTS